MDKSCSYRSLLPCRCLLAAPAGTAERATALTSSSPKSGLLATGHHVEYRSAVLERFQSVVCGVKNGVSGSVKM